MRKKIYLAAAIAVTGIVFSQTLSAQSWYSDYLNYSGNVAGAKSSNAKGGKPETLPSTDKKPSQSASSRQNSAQGAAASENAQTHLRRNDFSEIQELKNLSQEERQTKIAEMKAQRLAERCEIIKTNITRRIDYYQNSQTTNLNRYQGIVVGVEKAVTRLNELGYDTTTLDASIAELKVMITDLNGLHNDLVFELMSSNGAACTEDQTEFKTKVQAAQASLKELRTQAFNIREYIRTEVVAALTQLKGENNEDLPENEVDESNEVNNDVESVE